MIRLEAMLLSVGILRDEVTLLRRPGPLLTRPQIGPQLRMVFR